MEKCIVKLLIPVAIIFVIIRTANFLEEKFTEPEGGKRTDILILSSTVIVSCSTIYFMVALYDLLKYLGII